ncbi:hypothetical protein ACIQU5_12635 [Streptomyces sp. NPDC090306]|uniref:hypothetical protein n=1 Tax=Streptomyces sp. NPDC090306 TaxID=3365961 RepID=UPI003826EAE2
MATGLSWQQLRDLRLSELTDAADGWAKLMHRADSAREHVDADMSGKLTKTQESESARSAVRRLKRLGENYHYIQTETGLIRGTLDGFASELSAPQRQLRNALDDAASSGYTVNEDGSVDYPAGGKNTTTGDRIPGGSVMGDNGLIGAGSPGKYRDGNGICWPRASQRKPHS